jgi:hypothetical protein
VKLIAPVTIGKDIPLAIIDDEDYDFISSFRWSINKTPAGNCYYQTRKNNKTICMHRLVIKAQEGEEVDHINRLPHDNRKSNLRICNDSGTSKNKSSKTGSSSKYLGVCWSSRDKNWRVTIKDNYKVVFESHYSTEEQAALAYNDVAIEFHGEFANLNIVPDEKYYRMLTLLEEGIWK